MWAIITALVLPANERGFELVGAAIQRGRIVVNEHRHEAVLQDRRDGGGKTGGAGDDFVAGLQLAVAELGAGQRGNGEQVGGGTGVAQQAGF